MVFFLSSFLLTGLTLLSVQADESSSFTSTFYLEYSTGNGDEVFSHTSTLNLIQLAAHDALVSEFKHINFTEVRVEEQQERRLQERTPTGIVNIVLFVRGACRGCIDQDGVTWVNNVSNLPQAPSEDETTQTASSERRLMGTMNALQELIQHSVSGVMPSLNISTIIQIS